MRRRSRRRGGTFTIVALATSTLLLVSGSIFMQSTTHAMQLVGFEARRSRAREAGFAGLAWAARDAAARGATEGRGVLELDAAVRVTVLYRALPEGPDLVADAEVTPQVPDDAPFKVTGVLARRGAGYVLTRFE